MGQSKSNCISSVSCISPKNYNEKIVFGYVPLPFLPSSPSTALKPPNDIRFGFHQLQVYIYILKKKIYPLKSFILYNLIYIL